ncbi:uncharacterized protein LOC129586560 isoform X2 [Paramacrobiotus metropolitanus]|uniref:uncharacterized protein LOC129586560 isoform X2 n=1 Tax=Paramacrobiotus metropolitanus TaxID=2943436 RepID=UPI002445A12E|nr:uncharacterized protein LOC129586560 isoform X2 [Paramacrobiotus metropolitanus]
MPERCAKQTVPFGPTGSINATNGNRLAVNFIVNFNLTGYAMNSTISTAVQDWAKNCKWDDIDTYLKTVDISMNNNSQRTFGNVTLYNSDDVEFIAGLWLKALISDKQKRLDCINSAMQIIVQDFAQQVLNVTVMLNTSIENTLRDWMVRRITASVRFMAWERNVTMSAGDQFIQGLTGNGISDLAALSTNLTVNNITDVTHVLAVCANYTAYYATAAVLTDPNNRTAAFAAVVNRVLRTCCDHLFVNTAVAELLQDIYNMTAVQAKQNWTTAWTADTEGDFSRYFIWGLVTDGWMRQIQDFIHLLANNYSVSVGSDFWATHAPSEPPMSTSVVIVSLAIVTSGINTDEFMTTLRYQNLLQNITLIFNNASHILWLYEDPVDTSHYEAALASTIVGVLNFVTALGVTAYFVRQLRKSERYQLPVPKEPEPDDDFDTTYN